MSYDVKIVEDSVAEMSNVRLTTFCVTYPRFVHAEFLRHRLLSRCVGSSRAIPSRLFRERVLQDPALPLTYGVNQRGMQAGAELEGWRRQAAEGLIRTARYGAVGLAWALDRLGVHKQHANRYLEPWQWVTEVITATEWDNLWFLREHKDAMPELQHLVGWMHRVYDASKPSLVRQGGWHLPYIEQADWNWALDQDAPSSLLLARISAARCARTSYLNHEGKRDIEKDLALYAQLADRPEGEPLHMSPTEHQAISGYSRDTEWSGNFRGWIQHRKTIRRECKGNCPGD